MIKLHKLNNDEFALNHRHIEIIEERPDTTITLINEKKYIVTESIAEIIKLIAAFERNITVKYKTKTKFKEE